ncbi:hypothetical protein DOTSEDRAFT_70944 [Dothistroma septosporum NZE10]|uniref:Uncharacterized protein n=1 Tax=Dothistroma septosporum (strain NZE10 / CBS 128990) TaxID=675120 RepID=N1PRS5_DOTSN|nr:hypothetical protein DOTSEDRAFT_70944 [Dothistroma septosporum NZE10]
MRLAVQKKGARCSGCASGSVGRSVAEVSPLYCLLWSKRGYQVTSWICAEPVIAIRSGHKLGAWPSDMLSASDWHIVLVV